MNTTLIILTIALVLFITACVLKIASERRKNSRFLSDFDERHAARTIELNTLIALIDKNKKDSTI